MLSKKVIKDFVYNKIEELGIDISGNTKVGVVSCGYLRDFEDEDFNSGIYYYISIRNLDTDVEVTPFYYNAMDCDLSVLSSEAFMCVWDCNLGAPNSKNYKNIGEVVTAFNAVNKKANNLRKLISKI